MTAKTVSPISHTPGPWTLERGSTTLGDDTRTIRSSNGHALMSDETYYPWCPDADADWFLICAAPDLLAALHFALDENNDWQHVRDVLRAAVVKAENR